MLEELLVLHLAEPQISSILLIEEMKADSAAERPTMPNFWEKLNTIYTELQFLFELAFLRQRH